MVRGVFNFIAHVGVGRFSGIYVVDPRYRHWAYLVAGTFLAYETLQAWRKGDKGFPELKEYGWGLGIAYVERRFGSRIIAGLRRWFDALCA